MCHLTSCKCNLHFSVHLPFEFGTRLWPSTISLKEGTSKQVGVQVEIGRCRETTQVQSPNCDEGLLAEEGCGLRRNFCPSDIHPDGVEHRIEK